MEYTMSQSRRIFFSSLAGLVLYLSAAALATADPLVLTIHNPNQFALPGQPVTFSASVTNTGTTNPNSVVINTMQISVTAFSIEPPDFAPFGSNFQGQVVPVSSTIGPLPILTVTILNTVPLGSVISGTINVHYNGFTEITETQNWSITVGTAPEAVPEPATMILLATGLAGPLGFRRVRRKFRGL